MTYIEFFEKTATENICACLTAYPERVVLIGRDKRTMLKSIDDYNKVLSDRGKKVEFIIKTANPNDLMGLVSFFEKIVEKYGHCVFDLTGGDDLYLVAAGMVYEKHKNEQIELIRFNVNTATVYDCDRNGEPVFTSFPSMSIEENVRVYGGSVIFSDSATYRWDNTPELFEDVDKLWKICKRDVKKWNSLVNMFEAADKIAGDSNSLDADASIASLSAYTERLITKRNFDFDTLEALKKSGLISSWEFNGSKFGIHYKNKSVKRCLTKAGQVLEMKIYVSALRSAEKGEKAFNDVLTGVCIDWDGTTTGTDTENEMDVMMMRGLVPVFVSCKNGFVEIDELYKLNTVAFRFGGKYAKKILVASALDLDSNFGRILKARADDMDIRVIGSEIVSMTDREIERKINVLSK